MATVSDFIRSRQDDILTLWADEADKVASARGLTGAEFRDVVPTFLAALAKGPGDEYTVERHALLETHLGTRLRQGFQLVEIVDELSLLGRCIARMWAPRAPSEQPSLAEVEWLFSELHDATALATKLFNQHMLEDEQTDKRYARLIQRVADEAKRIDSPTFRERLREVLVLILDAMGADTAALLLYDADGHELVTAAAAGLADEELERYATQLNHSSFAVRVAARENATTLDAATTELKVSDSLRQSGIVSLLGIRLPPRHRLLGVLYVGVRERRSFSGREIRRLESLGEQVTLHLDNAALLASLTDSIGELRRERVLRERFVSVLAHDLRGPLAAAKIAAQLLVRHPEKLDERRDLAIKIDRNIERTDRMVRDLLDANRIRAGERLPLRLDACDLGYVALEVVEELNAVHGERFVLRAESGVRGIWSAEELRRALWNLASNALKYGSPDGPIAIGVRRTPSGAEASVHNEGEAISPADQAHLFDAFSRTSEADASVQRGWGLGLTIVRGCAEAHGGTIDVDSAEGKGTTFTLRLPWDARPYQRLPAPVAPAEAAPPLH